MRMTSMFPSLPSHPGRAVSMVIVLALILICNLPLLVAAGLEPRLEQARAHMRAQEFEEAVALLEALDVDGPAEARDTVVYLKALALFHQRLMARAITATETLEAEFAESQWLRKARFLRAAAFADQKRYREAEAVYAAEANRLLSDTRKHEIAGVIIQFADQLAAVPDADRLDAPPPDYRKAYTLYGNAMQIEIGRDLRDDVMFKRARAIYRAGSHHQAIQDFQAYLLEFDPDWTGASGGAASRPRSPNANADAPGQHRHEARFYLASALNSNRMQARARWEAEDLLRMLADDDQGDSMLAADTRWLIVNSYGMPDPAVSDIDRAVQAARAFLEHHRNHRRAFEAAYRIAQTYSRAGRGDQAVAAYRDFLDGNLHALPAPGEPLEQSSERDARLAAAVEESWRPSALYAIGRIRFEQQQYAEAIAVWQDYAVRFPHGPHWAASQNGIIDAEFQKGIHALTQTDYEQARRIFENFLAAHPLDARARQVLFTFGQMHYAFAEELEEQHAEANAVAQAYEKAIDQWRKLVSQYPNTEEASLALYRTGTIYEEKLGQLERALEAYRRLNWGAYAAHARQRIAVMTQKELRLATERTFRSNEQAFVRVNTRNIDALTVKTYRLDLEAYFRKTHALGAVESLDVALIEPDAVWAVEIERYADYKPLEQTISIAFANDEPGAYVVNVSDNDWQATTLVIRSDLDVIVKSSRRETLVFAQNRLTRQPVAGVRVLLSDGEAVFAAAHTGPDGVSHGAHSELKEIGNVAVLAIHEGHVASHNMDLSGLQLTSGLTPKGYVYTDRPAYRPGEAVSLRGIVRELDDRGAYATPAGKSFEIGVTDANGRLLHEETRELSEFGTFHTAFRLPETAGVGQYTITVRHETARGAPLVFHGEFLVHQFILEKIRLTLEFPRRVYFRGEHVEAKIAAQYYWGEPVANAPLRYTLPDGRGYQTQTDAGGVCHVRFDTSGMAPGSALPFSAVLEGQNVSVQGTAVLARVGFALAVSPSQDVVLSGEPVEVSIAATGADGTPVAREMTLHVLRRQQPAPDRVLSGVPWLAPPTRLSVEATVEEHKVRTDPESGRATVTLRLEKGGRYILRAAGNDRFGQAVTGSSEIAVSDAEDQTKLRLFSEASTLQVGSREQVRLHARVADHTLALVTFEGETILRYRIIRLDEGFNNIDVEVGHDLFPNFRLAVAGMDGRELRLASREFAVERELRVSVNPLQDAYEPGDEAMVELQVTDQLGRPVRAELSLALVNEALFAIYPDRTPHIRDVFQADERRHAEFRTGSSNGFAYRGVTRPVLKDILDEAKRLERQRDEARRLAERRQRDEISLGAREHLDVLPEAQAVAQVPAPARPAAGRPAAEPMITAETPRAEEARAHEPDTRRDMPEAGYWLPAIVTGDDGKATVAIPMPDTTTMWRLTARGCTPETLVGEATAQALTRKEFFVDVRLPAVVREGDRVRVLTHVHNLTDYAGPVEVRLAMSDANGVFAEQSRQIDVAPGAAAGVPFDAVAVMSLPAVEVRVTAVGGLHSDALVTSLSVLPWGLEYADQGGGVARGDARMFLNLPDGPAYEHRWLTVSVGPVLQNAIVDMALDGRVPVAVTARSRAHPPMPPHDGYGASTGSELLAVLSGLDYARRHAISATVHERLQQRSRALIATLVASQRQDGAWPWHAGGDGTADWAATARAYWALAAARDAGLAVHPDTLAAATGYLENRFRGFPANDNDGKAAVLHALSVNNRADFAHANRLYRERNGLSNAALAYAALAFINLERREMAAELTELLVARAAVASDAGIARAHWEHGVQSHAWLQDDLETTALILLALARVDPASPTAEAAAQYLLRQRGCFGFRPAKARGPAVHALATYYSEGIEAAADFRITLSVNGHELARIGSDRNASTQRFAVPAEMLEDGENTVAFTMAGRGAYTYAGTLLGFSRDIEDPQSWVRPRIQARHYYHRRLEYRGREISARSTSPVRHLEHGQRTEVHLSFSSNHYPGYLIVEEPLPAGAMLVEGSPSGNFTHYTVDAGRITFFYPAGHYANDIRYELVGYAPGDFRVLPTVMRDAMNPGRMRIGPVGQLAVLAPREPSPDPYHMNNSELYELGRLLFADGVYDQALEFLSQLFDRHRTFNERDVARMLLWIHTDPRFYHAERIIQMFEILRERYPQLEIPFDRILVVGQAYRDIGEFERAWLVFRATIEASFISDSNVSAVLEDQGRFLGSIDYQERLWREYPDVPQVVAAYFALSQSLCGAAPKAHDMPPENGRRPDRIDMLERAATMLMDFLTLYPTDPLAGDAAFSLANAYLDLRQYRRVIVLSRKFAERYAASQLTSSFQYMTALGLFWERQHRAALEAARTVAEGASPDRAFAQYIVAQIHHALGEPRQAIEWYRHVAERYPDAAAAINYFERADVSLDELNVFRPGDPVQLTLRHRNVREVHLQIYRVDLMGLYLREKSLGGITQVHLAGIHPETDLTIELGDGRDYADKESTLPLDLADDGAYLVICRGDDLFTSSLVLVTPLHIEVQEDAVSGRVRVNVRDLVEDSYRADVHVKVIGSADSEFKGGETDLRGIFVADRVRGKTTAIARDGDRRYAFYRGDQWLGAPADQPSRHLPVERAETAPADYQMNLRDLNTMLQMRNVQQFDQMRRAPQKGVEVQKAF